MANVAATANEILTEWETALRTFRSHKKNIQALLPTALQLYRLGLFLDNLSKQKAMSHKFFAVQVSYHEFLHTLPTDFCDSLLQDLNQAFWEAVRSDEALHESVADALRSFSQLVEGSIIAAQTCPKSWSLDDLSVLLNVYPTHSPLHTESNILALFRTFLLHSSSNFEIILPALHLLQQDSHIWMKLTEYMYSHTQQWKQIIVQQFDDESQQDYLTSLLATDAAEERRLHNQTIISFERASNHKNSTTETSHRTRNTAASTDTTAASEMDRRIAQVQGILPDYGAGFIEIALAAHQGMVDATVATLLENDNRHWPTILQATDRHLPRRKRDFTLAPLDNDTEAKNIAKAAVRATQRQQQEEALLVDLVLRTEEENDNEMDDEFANAGPSQTINHSEYNDDYDDQFDDIDGVGNVDIGLYDDFDAIRAYNKALKEMEKEQSFWHETSNTNQNATATSNTSRKKQFGPDKIKGGRIPDRDGRGPDAAAAAKVNRSRNEKINSDSVEKIEGVIKSNATSSATSNTKPNLRQKARKLDKRREQQKKAQVKRSGA